WLQQTGPQTLEGMHVTLGRYRFLAATGSQGQAPQWLMTENETDQQRLFGTPNAGPYVKDAFHEYIIRGKTEAIDPDGRGTKAAAYYVETIPAGGSVILRLRFFDQNEKPAGDPLGDGFEAMFEQRIREADEFYDRKIPGNLGEDSRLIARQAYAGLLW